MDLILPDPEGRIQDWFDNWLPTSESRMVLEWPRPQGNFSGTSAYYTGQELPAPNWSRPPAPKINSWYRPTGASRWAFGFFLADQARLQTILNNIGTNNIPQILTLDMFPLDGHTRSWGGCYLLPPHPVSATATDTAGLWILPIVDERWYWQFLTITLPLIDNVSQTATAWSDVFSQLATALGISLTADMVSAVYLNPNIFALAGGGPQNPAVLLDAVAFSVGQRIIPQYVAGYGPPTVFPGMAWLSAGWPTSVSLRTSNLSFAADIGSLQTGFPVALQNRAALAPANITVVFRAYRNGIVIQDWKANRYSKTIEPIDAGWTAFGTTSADTLTLYSTALADFTKALGDFISPMLDCPRPSSSSMSASSGTPVPDNQSDLDSLALQIARDYYASIWVQDVAVVGISQWQESGFDDFVEFFVGRPDDVDQQPSTRIHSQPYNQLFKSMLHYHTSTWEYGNIVSGILKCGLSPFGKELIAVDYSDGAIPTGSTLTVTDIHGWTVKKGKRVTAQKVFPAGIKLGAIWADIAAQC